MKMTGTKKVILGMTILGGLLIVIGSSLAFQMFQFNGSHKHIIKAANMEVVLEELSDGITIEQGYATYDEVGMIGPSYDFRLVNKGGIPATYYLKLKDVTTSENKLSKSDVRFGLTKNGTTKIDYLSNWSGEKNVDVGVITANETINYQLHLWIRDGVTDATTIDGKTIKLKAEVDTTDDPLLLIGNMKQGSYVDYVGANGCKLSETAITGGGNAESGDSCKGYNANGNGASGGWCYESKYPYSVSGWRIAYTENSRAYLISAGAPECATTSTSSGNTTYINMANTKAKKYCNREFVDGDCTNNNDSWAINNNDFNKITKQATGTGGGYIHIAISGGINCYQKSGNAQCGYGNNLIDNGGHYYFASYNPSPYNASHTVYWFPSGRYPNSGSYIHPCGLRPIIRLSSAIYVSGGTGTAATPYKIAKSLF